MRARIPGVVCALVLWQARAQEPVAIAGAVIVDGTGAPGFAGTVLVRDGRIERILRQGSVPAGYRVVRAEGHTLLPGLFDVHTHLPYSAVSGVEGDWAKILKAYLVCGVTTVVDFGVYPEQFAPMRKLLAEGALQGPRLHLAARMTTPGGHGAEAGRGDFFSAIVLTPAEARAALRRLLPYRPDVIKVFTDGWRYGSAPDMTSMQEDTLAAIVEEAHRAGVEVLTHTVTLARAKIAARAGVDAVVHGIGDAVVDDELIRLLRNQGTAYASTLAVYEPRETTDYGSPLLLPLLEPLARRIVERRLTGNVPRVTAGSLRLARWKNLNANVVALHKANIPLLNGTDAGVTGTYHGWATLRELKLHVAAGLTPMEAIVAATRNSARVLHVDAERGTIEPGKLADMVLVEGRPDVNIDDLEQVRRVFFGGLEIDRPALLRSIASAEPTPLPVVAAPEWIDNCEDPLRTSLGTRRVNGTDSGHDNSRMTYGLIARENGGHALSLHAFMAEKPRPFARLELPLSAGAVLPVDARAFQGVEFEARGSGEYRLIVPTSGVRDFRPFSAEFRAGARWALVRMAFEQLKSGTHRWRGDDLLSLWFEVSRPAGSFAWLEIDNVRFYR